MATYLYKGYDKAGTPVKGEISADAEADALAQLQRQNIMVETLKAQAKGGLSFNFGKKLGFQDIEFLTSELSILLGTGVKIDKALALLSRAKLKPELGQLIQELSRDLKSGESLANAFAKHPKYFDNLYITLLTLGEESGELPKVLAGLAEDMKFKRQLRAKITQASVYPMVILFVCVASVFFIFNYIVPQMSTLFEGREQLPVYTEFVLGLSRWMQDYQFFLIGGIGAAVIGIYLGLKNDEYRPTLHRWMLEIPIVRTVVRMTERIRFCAGSALMLNAGLSADRVLKLVAGTIYNDLLRQEVMYAWEQVRQGTSLTKALENCRVMDDFYVSLLEIGEESGELERVFSEIADRSREDFENKVTRFTNLLEPMLILTMGLLVGGVVVTLILSIVSITDYG